MYIITPTTTALAHHRMDNPSVKKLWNSFTLTKGQLAVTQSEDFVFQIGSTPIPALTPGKEYALQIDEQGAAVVGRDYDGLMRGYFTLLMKLEHTKDSTFMRCTREESEYLIQNRMIHICVFPENDLYFIKKLIRLSALCQYTHIVIEFWGMLQYDCLKELAWPNAFTKAQAKELIDECRELGIEPIPMFNMFGHATASRACYGKHVVLDQNPTLQYLFTPDGWAWDITSEEVFTLLKQVRQELYDLFGETEYFHLGCDEAHYYSHRDDLRDEIPKFFRRLTGEIAAEGRRPMIWMDMLLEHNKFPGGYYAFARDGESQVLLDALAKETVMVDWQYNVTKAPILTSVYLKDKGHDLLIAPWYENANYFACLKTAQEHNLSGLMLTTWHTLKNQMHSILGCAKDCGAKSFVWSIYRLREETAALLRRVSFEGNTYDDCGWSKKQIEI